SPRRPLRIDPPARDPFEDRGELARGEDGVLDVLHEPAAQDLAQAPFGAGAPARGEGGGPRRGSPRSMTRRPRTSRARGAPRARRRVPRAAADAVRNCAIVCTSSGT